MARLARHLRNTRIKHLNLKPGETLRPRLPSKKKIPATRKIIIFVIWIEKYIVFFVHYYRRRPKNPKPTKQLWFRWKYHFVRLTVTNGNVIISPDAWGENKSLFIRGEFHVPRIYDIRENRYVKTLLAIIVRVEKLHYSRKPQGWIRARKFFVSCLWKTVCIEKIEPSTKIY